MLDGIARRVFKHATCLIMTLDRAQWLSRMAPRVWFPFLAHGVSALIGWPLQKPMQAVAAKTLRAMPKPAQERLADGRAGDAEAWRAPCGHMGSAKSVATRENGRSWALSAF